MMKKKINFYMCLISILATVFTAAILTFSYYGFVSDRAWEQIEDASKIVMNESHDKSKIKQLGESIKNRYRITLVEKDGVVSYDNQADVSKMDNHGSREEVVGAIKNGSARAVRDSATVGKNTYYYATYLGNGRVLRVAADTNHIMATFASSIPVVVGVSLVSFLFCMVISRRLTKLLIRPIEQMAEAKIDVPYEELMPFAKYIHEQKAIERMKQEFTANVSHELKTPLTSISGYAELIEEGMARPEDVKTFAGKIHSEARRVITLIGDIMKLSELEEPASVCEFEPVLLSDVVEECVTSLDILAKKKDVTFVQRCVPAVILGDRKMVAEIVYNLMDNAIRYNRMGGNVTVSVLENANEVWLSVKDTGIGIPEEKHVDIFRRFYRVDKSRSKETGGTGLGLAIVKHIAELHEARIEVKSVMNEGTEIIVHFIRIGEK